MFINLKSKELKMCNNLFEKPKVLLVSTNFCRHDEERTPYGVSCLVNAFRQGQNNGTIDTFAYDLNGDFNENLGKFSISYEKTAALIAKKIIESSCNIAAFSVFAWSDVLFKKTMAILGSCQKRPIIVMGGPMVCGGLETLKKEYPFADFFIESYGEKVFENLGEYLSRAEKSGNPLIKDLPVFEKLTSPYLSGLIPMTEGMTVRMELRRGCLFNCSFCRHRNPEQKVFCVGCMETHRQELMLFKVAKVRKINVLDPYFNDGRAGFKGISLEFLKLLKELKITADVSLQIRPETLTDEYLDIAETMPNIIFEIGVQSLDEKVMSEINRGGCGTKEKVLEKLKEVAKRGIRTEITLIYGLPYQTVESFRNDVNLLITSGFSKITAFPLQIYRGTEMFDSYKSYGLKAEPNDLAILEVCDDPAHDIDEMRKIACLLSEYPEEAAA